MSTTTTTTAFRDMSRRQAIELCHILEEQRDKQIARAKVAETKLAAGLALADRWSLPSNRINAWLPDVATDLRAALTKVQAGAGASGCKCTMLKAQTHIEPAEWEQADDCPVHPLTPAPAPVDDREALAALIFANRDRKVEGIADAILAAGYVKGGQATFARVNGALAIRRIGSDTGMSADYLAGLDDAIGIVNGIFGSLATPAPVVVSDAAVEAGAKALYEEERNESMGFDAWPEYDDADNAGREIYEDHARACLTAALPHLTPAQREAGKDATEPWRSDDCAGDACMLCLSEALGCGCSCHGATTPKVQA